MFKSNISKLLPSLLLFIPSISFAVDTCNCNYNDDFEHHYINLSNLISETQCKNEQEKKVLTSMTDGEYCTCSFIEANPLTEQYGTRAIKYGGGVWKHQGSCAQFCENNTSCIPTSD